MEILGIIPARGGSKRIPRKNIKMIAGKPLVAWTIEAGLKSKLMTKVIVSTEDNEIAKVSKEFGAEVMDRPLELAQDVTKSAPVMIDVVEKLKKEGYNPDIVVLLQATSPLRDANILDGVLEKLINSDKDSVFTGHIRGRTMPLWVKNHDGSMNALYDYHLRPRSQEPELNSLLMAEDGACYAIKIDAFKKFEDFIGENPDVYEIPFVVDIDTEKDFEKAEEHLKQRED